VQKVDFFASFGNVFIAETFGNVSFHMNTKSRLQRKILKSVVFESNPSPLKIIRHRGDVFATPLTAVPFVPPSWASSNHPSERPPSPIVRQSRLQMSSCIVDSVFRACQKIDPGAELASATFTSDGATLVRLRTGLTCSISTLQSAIASTMPLCATEIVDSSLDGTTEIGVIVSTPALELAAARGIVRKKPMTRIIGHIGLLCFLFGFFAWLVSLAENLTNSDKREL